MHKGSVKKLEDDLAVKLHELSSAKEQLADLEKQLKSSKNLLETNLSIKKVIMCFMPLCFISTIVIFCIYFFHAVCIYI